MVQMMSRSFCAGLVLCFGIAALFMASGEHGKVFSGDWHVAGTSPQRDGTIADHIWDSEGTSPQRDGTIADHVWDSEGKLDDRTDPTSGPERDQAGTRSAREPFQETAMVQKAKPVCTPSQYLKCYERLGALELLNHPRHPYRDIWQLRAGCKAGDGTRKFCRGPKSFSVPVPSCEECDVTASLQALDNLSSNASLNAEGKPRLILFIGDSVIRQIHYAFQCLLQGMRVHLAVTKTVPNFFMKTNLLNSMREADVVVLNFGAHYNVEDFRDQKRTIRDDVYKASEYNRDLRNFVKYLDGKRGVLCRGKAATTCRCKTIWVESLIQHYSGGVFKISHRTASKRHRVCNELSADHFFNASWRNRMANAIVETSDMFQILKVQNVTYPYWKEHNGHGWIDGDCTHFCSWSVPLMHVVSLTIFKVLQVLDSCK